jgi:hypothetical protein
MRRRRKPAEHEPEADGGAGPVERDPTSSTEPLAGDVAAEFFRATIAAPLDARCESWFNKVAALVNEAVERTDNLTLDSVIEDAAFQSAIAAAWLAATRTAFDQKLDALSNAVANFVGLDVAAQHTAFIFIQFIDDLQPAHLTLLSYSEWKRARGSTALPDDPTLSHSLQRWFPEWDVAFIKQLLAELDQRGLIAGTTVGATAEGEEMRPAITQLGRDFLHFIRAPEQAVRWRAPRAD